MLFLALADIFLDYFSFSFSNYTIADIDECQLALHNCKPSMKCVNEPGSFHCDCHPGFIKVGENCKGQAGTTLLN